MSIQSALIRVELLRQELADPAALIGKAAERTGGTAAPSGQAGTTAFAQQLALASAGVAGQTAGYGEGAYGQALASYGVAGAQGLGSLAGAGSLQGLGRGAGAGARIVAVAESQLGQAEQPPGSNESPAIAEYRTATAGAIPGAPWCAYFASWAARQAGEPIGSEGQGLGAVSEIWSWAQSTGRAVTNGPGVTPRPGDLIVFGDEHVGIVREVLPDGRIATIEGNYENKVAANVRSATEATGYVSMS